MLKVSVAVAATSSSWRRATLTLPRRCGGPRTRLLSSFSSWSGTSNTGRPAWSEEWKRLGLGAELIDGIEFPENLFFVQMGFGVDQHGDDDATKAAVRAVRNAVEFNSIPGVIMHLPGGRKEMLVHVKLGVPPAVSGETSAEATLPVDRLEVAKVFPYGRLLPIEVTVGGLAFHTGRVVEELGDTNDVGICVAACVSIGYNNGNDNHDDGDDEKDTGTLHRTYSTKDGY